MLKEHFTLMWRKASRNKVFTLINTFGLSVGIAVFILIIAWAQREFSHDKFNTNIDNIYRIEMGGSAYMVSAIGQAFANEFPEIEKFVRFRGIGSTLLTYETESILLENAYMADSTLFDIFTFEFLYGNPGDALVTPFSIVLTETTARTLFGNMNPVGKAVKTGTGVEAIITGVIKDVSNTHMPIDAVISFVTLGKVMPQSDYLYSFGTSQFATYFLISEGVDIGKLAERMTDFIDEIYVKHGRTAGGHENELVPLKDIYFHDVHYQSHLHGNLKFVYIFLLVSILTLVIACINFINLTIAKSSTVVREVGVKKVFGASQKQLFAQFLFESIILCFISSLFAIIIIRVILPEFNHLTGGHISLEEYLNASHIIIYFLIVILIGFLAGIYPAIRLSSFNPIQYLRKFGNRGISRSPFRTALVIFQFTISIILTLSIFVVIRQLNFMKEFKTGFNTENIILLRLEGEINKKRDAFKNEIMAIPNIEEIAFTSSPPGTVDNYESFTYEGVKASFPVFTVDPSFLPMLGVRITEGRNFDWERPNDRLGVCILNREAVELFSIDNPVGSFLKHQYYLTTIPKSDIEIIGVIDDYQYVSPKDSVGPALFCFGNWYSTACLKVNPDNLPMVLKQLETVWNKFAQGFPFEYQYLDEFYGRQYQSESTLSRILIYFAFVAILIACLGLLGLASFLAQEKTREIGIRKVFGATSTLIVRMLSTQYLKWVIVAIIIGSPLAVIIMNKWLMNFAYHTTVSWWLIVLAAIILLSVSLFTVLFHIVRVSGKNPVYALKYE